MFWFLTVSMEFLMFPIAAYGEAQYSVTHQYFPYYDSLVIILARNFFCMFVIGKIFFRSGPFKITKLDFFGGISCILVNFYLIFVTLPTVGDNVIYRPYLIQDITLYFALAV